MSAEPLQPAEVVRACLDAPTTAAWEKFVRLFQPTIASGAISVVRQRNLRPDPALIDDLIQEAYFKICKDRCRVLRAFTPRGDDSIFSYIKVVAITSSQDHFRTQSAKKRGQELQAVGKEGEAASSAGSVEKETLFAEMERHLERLVKSVRDRDIFWLYYRAGYNAREIASLPDIGLSAKGVESLIFRLTRILRDAIGPSWLPGDGSRE